tara:strand:+ start:2056 stop:2745 length:690 start_codon:yes stop_codon:yes gene_type:complete
MNQISCHIIEVNADHPHLYKVYLKPEQQLKFKAGQYLCIIMGEEDKRPFSIASAPHQDIIELHIGAGEPDSYPMQVIDKLRSSDEIMIEAPHGRAYLRETSERPRVIIAGGTGFSYAKSIIESLIHTQQDAPTHFFWGCRKPEYMYDFALAQQWNKLDWLQFTPVLEHNASELQASEGMLLDQVCQQISDFSDYDIYIAGRFEMAKAAKDKFLPLNLNTNQLFGDAFSY